MIFSYYLIVSGEQGCPMINTSETVSNQSPDPNPKSISIQGIFSGSPSKGMKQRDSNTIFRNKVS